MIQREPSVSQPAPTALGSRFGFPVFDASKQRLGGRVTLSMAKQVGANVVVSRSNHPDELGLRDFFLQFD
jgi:hypothetical protein